MREIKFKGKSVMTIEELEEKHFIDNENGWFTGNLVMKGDTPYIVGDFIEVDEEYTINEFWVKVFPDSVGQYTGLKDKNGKEIYEGDIVHLHIPSEPYTIQGDGWMDVKETEEIDVKGPIVFKYSMFGIKTSERGIFPLDEPEFTKIIGNIYENPNPLKGASK